MVHKPGTHEGNTLVVEIKGNLNRPDHILKDFNTLTTFVRDHEYQAGVFILYGHSFDQLREKVNSDTLALASTEAAEKIYVLTILNSGDPCQENRFAELQQTKH